MSAWLVVMSCIFSRAGILAAGEPDLFLLLSGTAGSFKQSVFVGAYLAGMLVVVGCIFSAWRTVRLVSEKAAEAMSVSA